MLKNRWIGCVLALMSSTALWAASAPGSPNLKTQTVAMSEEEAKTHEALRALKNGLQTAMTNKDVDAILTCLHPNIVMTALNAEVSRGREGVKQYIYDKVAGPAHMVKSYDFNIDVDELTQLFGGDTGVAFGRSTQHYVLTTGLEFTADCRWTATLVREQGKWLIASIHASTNIFDNPLLNIAKRSLKWAVACTGVVCLLVGVFIGTRIRKPK